MYPVTALLSSLALGLTAQAAPSLKVTVSLANGDDHGAAGALPHVDASVINTGDDDVYIRPYNTILQEGWSTHDFEIDGSEADGEAPAPKFKGVFVTALRDPKVLKAAGDLVHLKAGQSKIVNATLDRYNFDTSGTGSYKLNVMPYFSVLSPDSPDSFQTVKADVESVPFHYVARPNRKRHTSAHKRSTWRWKWSFGNGFNQPGGGQTQGNGWNPFGNTGGNGGDDPFGGDGGDGGNGGGGLTWWSSFAPFPTGNGGGGGGFTTDTPGGGGGGRPTRTPRPTTPQPTVGRTTRTPATTTPSGPRPTTTGGGGGGHPGAGGPVKNSGCSSQFANAIAAAYPITEASAKLALQALQGLTNLDQNSDAGSDFVKWFGTPLNSQRLQLATSHFQHISQLDFGNINYQCEPADGSVVAFVYPDDPTKIHLLPTWLTLNQCSNPNESSLSQKGVLLHESSHFNIDGGTQDYTYGASSCMSMARSNPDHAIMNADSTQFFADQLYNSHC